MWFRSLFNSPRSRPRARRRDHRRPQLETLEDRSLLTLNPAVNLAVGASPLDLAAGDFSGDGLADLVTINGSQLSVLGGSGDGTFGAAQTTSAGTGLRALAAGYFDADSRLDLALTSSVTTWNGSAYVTEGFVHVLLNNGPDAGGNLTFETLSSSTGTNTTPGALAVGDLDGDGNLDVAVAQTGGNNVTVLLGNGDGSLQAGDQVAVGFNPGSVALGDFNGDTRLDIATANAGSSTVSLVLNDGGQSTTRVGFRTAVNSTLIGLVTAVAVGDFNADDRLDLTATSNVYYGVSTTGYVTVLVGNGDGTFEEPESTRIDNMSVGDVTVADLNDDGRLDVVTPEGPQPVAVDPIVLLGKGDGTFDAPYHYLSGTGPIAVVAADLNGDTTPDVAVANSWSASVSVLTNDGDWPRLGAPIVNIDDVWVTEGDTGTTAARFTVRLTAASSVPITVRYTTADDSARAGTDYQAATGVLTFKPGGPLKQTVTVLVNGDRRAEPWESFSVNLSNEHNVRIGDGQGFGSISDNEPRIRIRSRGEVVEGNEGTTAAEFAVTLAARSNAPVTVGWSTVDGGALAGSDYQAASGTLTFHPGGPLTQTVRVLVNGDRLGEYAEYFQVALSNGTGAYATIQDDEPRISISEPTLLAEANTGTTTAIFSVSLSAPSDEPVSVNFSTAEGDTEAWYGYDYYGNYYPPPPVARSGSDFEAQTGTVTFEPGQTSQTIRVVVNGDRLHETTEYFSVDLSDPSANAALSDGHAVGAIRDDEPRFFVNSSTVTEGNTGTQTATFTVILSAAYDEPVSVDWATADGTALAGSDYEAASGTLTFNPGEPLTQTVRVVVHGDRLGESFENFQVTLINGNSGWGTIQDDEPRISISEPTLLAEANTGTTTAIFSVSLSAPSDEPVSVNFSTAEGDTEWYGGDWYYGYYPPPPDATSGSDFEAQTGTVTFEPGQTSQEIRVVVNGDRLAEDYEYFSVDLSDPSANAALSDGHAVGAIRDDEPRFFVNSSTVTEGNTGTQTATFTVILSAAYDEPVSVDWATADGTALAGSDYEAASGTLTFNPGEPLTQTVRVVVHGDRRAEPLEGFFFNLSNPSHGVAHGPGQGLIQDDEPHLSIDGVSRSEGNSGTRAFRITVTLSEAYDEAVTVGFATQDDSATTAHNDYVATSGTLTFARGETTRTITVMVKGDKKREEFEYFSLVLSDASENAMIDYAWGWGEIENDDRNSPRRARNRH